MAKKEKEPDAATPAPQEAPAPKKEFGSSQKEIASKRHAAGMELWDKSEEVVYVDSDGSEYQAKICPLPTNKGVVIDIPQVKNPMEEFAKIAGMPIEKQAAAFAELQSKIATAAKGFSCNGNITRLAETKGRLCKSIEVGDKTVAAPDLLVDFGEKKGGVILKQRVRNEGDVPKPPANSNEKLVPFFRFLSILLLMVLGANAFAADSGAVNEGKQVWAGKKVFLDNVPTVTTLSGAATLDFASTRVQIMDANGSSRNVTLPAVATSTGYEFFIKNSSTTAVNLVVKNAAASTIVTVAQNESAYVWCDGAAWYGQAFSTASSGFLPASGATTGASSQAQTFTNGVVLDSVTGNTATALAIAAKVGSSAVGNAITLTGGAGNGAFAGGAASLVGGASGAGATGAGGAVAVTGGAAASTNGAGGAIAGTGGAGTGTGAGGAISATGGASGSGATGNGGAYAAVGGAALSTAGNGGAASVTGGLGTTTGAGGAVSMIGGVGGASGAGGALTLRSGASAGAGGTAGAVVLDTGAATGGTGASMTIGTTNALSVTLGKTVWTPATVQDVAGAGGTITVPTLTSVKRVTATGSAGTASILGVGTIDGQVLTLLNVSANSITFAVAATSNVADGASSVLAALTANAFVWDTTTSRWYHLK